MYCFQPGLVFDIEKKMLNSLSHILVIWVFHSFSLDLVDFFVIFC